MQVGLMAPQGWKGEYDGWDPAAAWARTVELATQAEELGFESLWVFDHFHTVPEPTDEITFESFSVLVRAGDGRPSASGSATWSSAPGSATRRSTAKLSSTIDVISGGRFELGIGAGWKEDEWLAYGYGFPPIGERMAAFGDHLEVITRMFAPGRATYEGTYAHVRGAINVPKGLQQPRIPIIVGGNGERRDAPATPSGSPTSSTTSSSTRRRDRRADGRRPAALRGGGPRPGDAAVLALHPRRGDARRRPGAGRPARRARGDRARPPRRFPDPLVADPRAPGRVRRGLSRAAGVELGGAGGVAGSA